MTDKEQIIIDGVDVSGCLFYQSNFEEDYDVRIKHFCSNWHNCCKSSNNQNCYFKQLKRKEQECEQIKEKYEALKLENQEGYEIVAELKHECEELKRKVELMMDCPDCKVDEYKKALEEIEKVINNILNSCLGRNTVSCRPANNVCGDLINILDIISKVKGEEF